MNLTSNECYTAYLDELRRYKQWVDERKTVYGASHSMAAWDTRDYERVMSWNGELKAIERVLGLTPTEVEAAAVSVGMETELTRKKKEIEKLQAELA